MRKRMAAIVVALGALATQQAWADNLLLSNTSLVVGSQSASYSFVAPGAGTVVAQITNVAWPQPLGGLSFEASSGSQVLTSWSEPPSQTSNTMSFSVSGPGMYFANVLATASGPLDLGVYSLSIRFIPTPSAVPLPAAVWELLGGLLALMSWRYLLPARSSTAACHA